MTHEPTNSEARATYDQLSEDDPDFNNDRIVSVANGTWFGSSALYAYDIEGRIASRTVNAGSSGSAPHTFAYEPAGLGRLLGETTAQGTFAYGYEKPVNSRVVQATYPNNMRVIFDYHPADQFKRLKEIRYEKASGALVSRHEYGYNHLNGNIAQWTQQFATDPAQVLTFGYDPTNQLTSAVQKRHNVTVKSHAYTYDKAGNRLSETRTVNYYPPVTKSGYAYNWLNQLVGEETAGSAGMVHFKGSVDKPSTVEVNGLPMYLGANNMFETFISGQKGTNEVLVEATEKTWGTTQKNTYTFNQTEKLLQLTHTYDADGNLVWDGEKSYDWDAKNQLTAIYHPDYTWTEFTYDGLGRRIKIIEKEQDEFGNEVVLSERRYLWVGGNQPYEEYDVVNNVATLRRRFFNQGEQVFSNGVLQENLFYTKDHLGSVRELVDSSVTVQASYDYDPYGRRTKVSGTSDTVVGYTGHHWHEKSGLYLTWYRQYDPNLGRWLSRDPIGERGGINLYGYVLNNPVRMIDKYGKEGSYASAEAAAQAALTKYHPLTLSNDIEYCGYVCCDPKKKIFSYTYAKGKPKRTELTAGGGTRIIYECSTSDAPCPDGTKKMRGWHTHPKAWGTKPDTFSPDDKRASSLDGIPEHLATDDGRHLVYDNITTNIHDLSQSYPIK